MNDEGRLYSTLEYIEPLLTVEDYGLFCFFHSATTFNSVLEISLTGCLKGGILEVSLYLINLTSVSITDSDLTNEDMDSLTKLKHLEKLDLWVCYLHDVSFVNFSALTKMKHIKFDFVVQQTQSVTSPPLNLSDLIANKEFSLVHLELISFEGIDFSWEFHCVSTLTNLTHLTIVVARTSVYHNIDSGSLDDIGLNKIISSCVLIQHLDIRNNNNCTIDGLKNIHCLIYLKTFKLSYATDSLLPKLSQNVALTRLDICDDNKLSKKAILNHLPPLCHVFANWNGHVEIYKPEF
jgi:hypothetical protein